MGPHAVVGMVLIIRSSVQFFLEPSMVLRAHVMLCDRVAFFENNIFDLKMGKM